MKKLLALVLFMSGCATGKPPGALTVTFADDIRFTHDQIIVCPYLVEFHAMACMTSEEFEARANSEEPKDP